MAKTELVVRRNIDGLGKKVDVRRFVRSLRLAGTEAEAALRDAGLIGELLALEAVVELGPTGSAKAAEVVEAVLGAGFPHKAVRVALLAGPHSPLDIASLRTTQKVVEASLAPV